MAYFSDNLSLHYLEHCWNVYPHCKAALPNSSVLKHIHYQEWHYFDENWLSQHSGTPSANTNYVCNNMSSYEAISCTHVIYDFIKCRHRVENAKQHNSCPYIERENIDLPSKNSYKMIRQADKEESPDENLFSAILEKPFEKYKAPSANVNLIVGCNNLWVVSSKM